MFVTRIICDGYTCRIIFARNSIPKESRKPDLTLDDFNTDEVRQFFTPVAVDPGRTNAVTIFNEYSQVRQLGTNEYYNMSGTRASGKQLQERQIEEGVHIIESQIPTTKTCNINQYSEHVTYILQHLERLFTFYGVHTNRYKWLASCGRQKALDEAVNIVINGGKKYNKSKRKKTSRNRKRKRSRRRRGNQIEVENTQTFRR
ncbi:hypothetical protein BDB01DRAFT_725745 [Pilobolus umbonatus]|nr:hypothetical protein BDB01DRAFT_725745 [Pilobolus umbonatus]